MPPNGFTQSNVRWIEIDAPDGYKLIAAVFRPSSPGPFPVVVVFHGSGGFTGPTTQQYGDHFAQNGFLVVAGGWFSGFSPRGGPAIGLIDWPKGPPFNGANLDSMKYADAIVKTSRMLPEADGKRTALFGTSRGAMISLLLASTGAGVQAVVADSAAYTAWTPVDTPAIGLIQNLKAPVLMLHGTADETANVREARDYEAALNRLNKPYEALYYEGSPHVVTRFGMATYDVAMNRAIAFLKKHLTGQRP